MPQVFVSYARADKRRVVKIVAMLRKIGFEPWWDDDIPPGASWEQTIEKALAESQAMIVCWSPVAIASENVRSEARFARSRGRLVQIFLEPCEPPLFFGERQGIDLSGWMGSARDPVLSRVKQALDAAIVLQPHHQPALTDTTRARRRLRYRPLIIALILAALAITAVAGWWRVHSSSSEAPSRVAVQPIKALGTDNMLAYSLTDQIVTSLNDGRIPTVSKTDSQELTGGDLDRRLKSLGVAYTLDGTIERSGKTLHARVHLHDRAQHASLWSYEAAGSTDAPTTLNSAIAQSITGVISCAHRAMRPGGLTDTELLSRYLRVCDLFVNHDDATGLKSTFELLDDLRLIMAKAPDFAPAQSDFAKFAAYLAPILPPQQASAVRVESARAARRALELDPHAADAYVAQEMLLRPTDWAQREALLRTAVSVDPRWPHGNGFLAMLLTETGRMREAAIYGQRAAAADLQIDWKPFGAKMACDAGQTDSAISDLREPPVTPLANGRCDGAFSMPAGPVKWTPTIQRRTTTISSYSAKLPFEHLHRTLPVIAKRPDSSGRSCRRMPRQRAWSSCGAPRSATSIPPSVSQTQSRRAIHLPASQTSFSFHRPNRCGATQGSSPWRSGSGWLNSGWRQDAGLTSATGLG